MPRGGQINQSHEPFIAAVIAVANGSTLCQSPAHPAFSEASPSRLRHHTNSGFPDADPRATTTRRVDPVALLSHDTHRVGSSERHNHRAARSALPCANFPENCTKEILWPQ